MEKIIWGTTASLLAGAATGIGALLVFFVRRESDKTLDFLLGSAAGIMLAATFFSLLGPAIELGGIRPTVIGIVLGAFFLTYAERFTPHMHMVTGAQGPSSRLTKVALFVVAITMHSFPEGMAVGVSFGGENLKDGIPTAIGIGLQNIPEGLAVAFALLRENCSRVRAFVIGLLTGLVEPVGGLLGASVVSIASGLLPYGLAFAGGAMLFVISEEVIPETHSRGNSRLATTGLMIGFVVMMVLDNAFG
ncbi:MAG: ZIP family metal transporter [Anaerohalosphaera sp.]|nr:ZIP family metal transporter [Anaerohalosphaera sp.]